MYFAKRWGALAWTSFVWVLATASAAIAAPTIDGFSAPTGGRHIYYVFGVHFTEPVTVTGNPTFAVRIGSVDREFTADGTYANYLYFQYHAQPGDNGPLELNGPIKLNGGTIKGSDGSDAVLTFTPPDTSSVIFDSIAPAAPVVNSVSPASPTYQQAFTVSGTAEPGATVYFRGENGQIGGSATADASGNWSVRFPPQKPGTYSYDVSAQDEAGNISPPTSTTITVQYLPSTSTTAQVESVTTSPDGIYNARYRGWVWINVVFTQPIVVTGNPTIGIRIGSTPLQASGAPNGERQILFTVTPGWTSAQGSLTITGPIDPNGGSIRGSDGVDASLSFAPVSAPGVIIDGVPPADAAISGMVPSSPTAADRFTIFGTAEAGGSVEFQTPSGYVYARADTQGNWSATFGPLPAGSYTYVYNTADAAGNWLHLSGGLPYRFTIQPAPTAGQQPQTITFASPVGAVTIGQPITLGATSSAGLPIAYTVVSGNATLSGNVLTPQSTATLIVRASSTGDATYAAASTEVNFGNPQKAAQTINASATTQTVNAGSTVTLTATSSSDLPVTYTVVSGPATVSGNTLTPTATSGTVQVRASQAGNDMYAAASDVTLQFDIIPVPTSRLVNISSRLRVSTNDSAGASIAGFVTAGNSPKQFLIRGVGPSLANYGVSSPLAAPQLKLYDEHATVVATNAGWSDDAQIAAAATAVGAFKYAAGSKDAALLVTLAPGAHTVQLLSSGGGTGMIEVYDVSATTTSTKQLINISTRGTVGSGDDVLIGGFVITGDRPKRVLIRGIGPKLTDFGVSGALQDAVLTVYDVKQAVIAKNDNWGTQQPVTGGPSVGTSAEIMAAATATGAFPLPAGSADAALLVTLMPGGYSAVVTGANNASGAGMVEIYEVPE